MSPYLQRLARMRASMVRDSIQSFTDGYKDGLELAKKDLSPQGVQPPPEQTSKYEQSSDSHTQATERNQQR
eukprot:scaffold361004_cov34-Prasinocladus_malaysianus.AAC.1